jgi:hypothetical protein
VTEIIDHVQEVTNHKYSRTSIRGSSIGQAKDKVLKKPWFTDFFIYVNGRPALVMKKEYAKEHWNFDDTEVDYNTPDKQKAREFAFKGIGRFDEPKVLTLAGKEGFDVKYLLELNPRTKIFNVEEDKEIFRKYKGLNLPTTDFRMTVNRFLKSFPNERFDYFNYDSITYLCKRLGEDLQIINENKIVNILSLTMMNIKKIRNFGRFVDEVKGKYWNCKDPTLEFIKDTLDNYDFQGEHIYKRDEGSLEMRVLRFRLRPENKNSCSIRSKTF